MRHDSASGDTDGETRESGLLNSVVPALLRAAAFVALTIIGGWIADWAGLSRQRPSSGTLILSESLRSGGYAVLAAVAVLVARWGRQRHRGWVAFAEMAVVAAAGLMPTRLLSALGAHSFMMATAVSPRGLLAGAYLASAGALIIAQRRGRPSATH